MKPGPGLSAEEVAAHQRGRLHEALVELVAEHGYNAVSVKKLADRARVSKRDFYKLFSSKEECFLVSYDVVVCHAVRAITAATEGPKEWRERLRLGFLAFADQITGSPETARLVLLEAFTAGAAAVERMERTNRLFEVLLAKNLAEGAPPLPPLVVKGVVAGSSRLARARLLSGSRRQLALDGDGLLEWALSFCDDEVARLPDLGAATALPPSPGTASVLPLESERSLIFAATARLASREGYANLTVPRVRAAAGISRQSFDAHFEGVADCFLATLEALSDRTLDAAAPLYLNADDWASGVHRMIVDLCRLLASDPTFTDLAFREAFSSSTQAIRWRSEMIAKLARKLRREAPATQRPSELAAEASIGAMWGVIHHFVTTGHGAQLPAAAPALSYLALAPALGGAAAVEVIAAEVGKGR